MKMDEFAEIIKKSKIAGNNKKKIIFALLQAVKAKPAISHSAREVKGSNSDQSPAESTIQTWLSGKNPRPNASRYFPNQKIEDKDGALAFFTKIPRQDQWKELRDLFKDWHNENPDKEFFINTDTNDLIIFSTSFWRQFASFFISLRMWDEAEEQYSETKEGLESTNGRLVNEMMEVFNKKFKQYKVYEFIPKEIESVIDSINIYNEIWHEKTDSDYGDIQNFKKMYCKLSAFSDYDCFIFCSIIRYKDFWVAKIHGKNVLLDLGEEFDYDMMPTNTWMDRRFKYADGNLGILQDEQFDSEKFTWTESQGEIIIVDIYIPSGVEKISPSNVIKIAPSDVKVACASDEQDNVKEIFLSDVKEDCTLAERETFMSDAKEIFSADVEENSISAIKKENPIFSDCYVLIDRMLEQASVIDDFIRIINEKIIKKYANVKSDNSSIILYNIINQYKETLGEFKDYLRKFKDLKKEKSQYIADVAFINTFGMYQAFSDFEVSPRPEYPFSEAYLNMDKAQKVISRLCDCHRSLIELYAEIFSYEKNYTI